jgi:hypothetical protein
VARACLQRLEEPAPSPRWSSSACGRCCSRGAHCWPPPVVLLLLHLALRLVLGGVSPPPAAAGAGACRHRRRRCQDAAPRGGGRRRGGGEGRAAERCGEAARQGEPRVGGHGGRGSWRTRRPGEAEKGDDGTSRVTPSPPTLVLDFGPQGRVSRLARRCPARGGAAPATPPGRPRARSNGARLAAGGERRPPPSRPWARSWGAGQAAGRQGWRQTSRGRGAAAPGRPRAPLGRTSLERRQAGPAVGGERRKAGRERGAYGYEDLASTN